MEYTYEFLNQYDRKAYIVEESTDNIFALTTSGSYSDQNNLGTVTVTSILDNKAYLSSNISNIAFKINKDISPYILDSYRIDDYSVCIEVSEYDKNYTYILSMSSGIDGNYSIIDSYSYENNIYKLYFKSYSSINNIILYNYTEIRLGDNVSYIDNLYDFSVNDTIYYITPLSTCPYRINKNESTIYNVLHNNRIGCSIQNDAYIDISNLNDSILLVDLDKNNLYINKNNIVKVTNFMFFIDIVEKITVTTNEEDMFLYMENTLLFPDYETNVIIECNGKIFPIGTRFPVKMSDRGCKVTFYRFKNIPSTISIQMKTFHINNCPTFNMLDQFAYELDIESYTPNIKDTRIDDYNSVFNKTISSSIVYDTSNIKLKDSDENKEIVRAMNNRYKIITKRVDVYVL